MKKLLFSSVLYFLAASLLGQPPFVSFTEESGIANSGNKNRGISFADYDNDGDQDIYAYTRLNENRLYENNGDGTFIDMAAVAGINYNGNTRAATWVDLNNDGFQDLYVANYQSPDIIYINNGPGIDNQYTFTDITASSGIAIENFEDPKAVIAADYDNDGDLDIYLSNFNTQNRLYRNNGDLTFTDVVYISNTTDVEMSMSAIFFDYDNDNDVDLYLVHDFDIPNILYQNDGNGYFTDVSEELGVDYAGDGMGVDVADINNDGWMDIYITNLYENTLYLNNADGTFTDISAAAGVQDYGMGWGTFFIDYDNDGWQDIYVINDTHFSPYPNVLYRNEGDNTFQKIGQYTDIASEQAGFGGACSDIDGDGFLDIVIANSGSAQGNQVFKNSGNDHHWIAFNLVGVRTNRNAVGAKVAIVYNGGEQQQFEEIHAGIGFAGQNDFKVHFGLAQAQSIDKVQVRWPNGNVQELFNLSSNQIYTITEMPFPLIHNTTTNDSIIEKYNKFELMLELDAMYDNPYDYDQIQVAATFISPSGEEKRIDGFYMQDFELDEVNGALSSNGNGHFKLRFAPTEEGIWNYQISVTDSIGTTTVSMKSFECVPISNPKNQGFVRSNLTNYLQFDEGGAFIMVGENMAWPNGNPYTNYKTWLDRLAENNGNFIRLWHANWGLGIEWKNGLNGFEGLRRYHEINSRYQDWLFDYCAEKGIYLMLTLQHHGQVSTAVNPIWNDNPYNSANGGMCDYAPAFFTDENARAHTKNRFRYIIARWGYARSIMAWELFNEVDWMDEYEDNKENVQNWHLEMAALLKQSDPNKHLVSTSFAHKNNDPLIWNSPDIDFTQTHFYIHTDHLENALAIGTEKYLEAYGKPTLTGEFGLGGNASLANADPSGIHIHNALWGSLFGGGTGTAMTWWWDNYIHPRNLYYHFDGVAKFANQIPFLSENMSPTETQPMGAAGDLQIIPIYGWGTIGESTIIIDSSGVVTPEDVGLCLYLYGQEWNTEFRSPPTFNVETTHETTFTVMTNSTTSQSPKIAIYLDGTLVLEQFASPNQAYSISIPAGNHMITVDNTGTDWITIADYTFSGMGSKLDAYVLIGESKQVAAGWLLNKEYNHENVAENGFPSPIVESELRIEGIENGAYSIDWFDCLSGEWLDSQSASASDHQLNIEIPALYWDVAFLASPIPLTTNKSEEEPTFKVFPSPASPGQLIHITIPEEVSGTAQLSLMDMSSKPIQRIMVTASQNNVQWQLPSNIVSGIYGLRIENIHFSASRPIVILKP